MSYAAVADITPEFAAGQWKPASGDPSTATVEAWLAEESGVLDGQTARVVAAPTETGEPLLYGLCKRIVVLRVAARVWDKLYRTGDAPSGTLGYLSDTWRKEANGLVAGILAGNIADGAAVGGSEENTGAPVGDFGATPGAFGMGQVW